MAKSESKMSTPGDSVESPNADEPAASTASVAASVATTTTTAKPTAEEPPSVFSNAAYACDRQYAIVLAQLMNTKDREKTYTWIRRLDTMDDCDEMREERDMYLKFLTLSLSNRKLVPPFTKPPPPGLRPLSTIVPRSVHNLIFKGKYETGDCRPPKDVVDGEYTMPNQVKPSTFFGRQPMPRDGGIVYAAAFSTRKPQ